METNALLKKVRFLLGFFALGLVLSGITAIPLAWEISLLNRLFGEATWLEPLWPGMAHWISFLYQGLLDTQQKYPFISYGTDWLAFAHFVIAIAFWGPLKDPVKNLWVIDFGLIACLLILPMVTIFGPLRGIPYFWQWIDYSFGLFGIIPLWLARQYVHRIMAMNSQRPVPQGA